MHFEQSLCYFNEIAVYFLEVVW